MKIPHQFMPVQGSGTSHFGIQPSGCSGGDLMVVLSDGKEATLKGAIECSYKYPKCVPTLSEKNKAYDKLIGQQFKKECGENNSKDCYYWTKCNTFGM